MPSSPESLAARAQAFATAAHTGQRRKGTDLPYLEHPAEVAALLTRLYPGRAELIAAGWLHDTVEDTATTLADIRRAFGPAVAALVAGATAVRGPDWRATRSGQLAKLAEAGPDQLRLKAADATSNARAIGRDRAALGPKVWKRFSAPPDDIRWYYTGILSRVRAGLLDEPLVAELAAAVAGLGLAGEP